MFNEHFISFKNKILNNENFALTRYGDGERALLEKRPISEATQAFKVDNWKYDGKDNVFSTDLNQTCFHREHNFFYGISCDCCDLSAKNYYKQLFQNHNLTFANLFVNDNYKLFLQFINNLNKDVILIANKKCKTASYPFKIAEMLPVENDCVNWYTKNKEVILQVIQNLAKKHTNKLFFISAGPLSEILIHNLYINNPNNTYIDVGSSLDEYTHRKITRDYQIKNSIYYNKKCILL